MATTSNGQFVWFEHLTRDPKAAIAFYGDVVGWKTQPFAESGDDYTMWVGSQGPLGGVMKLPEDAAKMGTPPHWMGDIQVADVDATAAKCAQLGGKVYHAPSDIPTVGRFAVLADPQGAVFAVFAPRRTMEAHEPTRSGEFCWSELITSDSKAAFAFYSELLAWKADKEMDMGPLGTYRTFGNGQGAHFGGIMSSPKPGMPPMWLHYAETPDLDAAIERATAKGAKVMNGPVDVPSGGRIAQLMDPQGAPFALHQSKP
jgi:predicted enzyme related to lactoylglutathione lyase